MFQDCHGTALRVTKSVLVNSLDCCQHVLASIPVQSGLTLQRVGKLGGESANMLFDSGAYYSFTSEAVVKARGWKISPATGHVQLADDRTTPILGTVSVPVSIEHYSSTVVLRVLPTMVASFDAIIGDAWMVTNGAVVDFGKGVLSFAKSKPRVEPEAPTVGPEYLNYAGVKRLVDQGCTTYLFIVRYPDSGCTEHVCAVPAADPVSAKLDSVDPSVRGQLHQLINQYSEVFPAQHPVGDPPNRDVPHIIPLEPGAKPVYKH
jgi:Retroviral aspartyl protease